MAGERLDRALAALMGWSRGRARRALQRGGVYLGKRRVRTASRKVRAGDRVQVWWADPPEPEPPPLPARALLARSQGLVAIDKPAGVHCQAARHRLAGTLPDLARALLGARDPIEPVHRLDRHCSGVVVLGETKRARRELSALWAAGVVRKHYLALVMGQPSEDSGVLDGPIGLDPAGPASRRMVVEGGQAAQSRYRLLEHRDGVSLLELEPLTGRTHQLRVHCAHAGWPMLGDPWYAPPRVAAMAPRLCLHAWRLQLPKGAPGTPCRLEAPVPPELAELGMDLPLT
jgi:23S rRNA pseudouridine1911/1915/1917 synthase